MYYYEVKKLYDKKAKYLNYKRYKAGVRIEPGLQGGPEFLFRYDGGTTIAKVDATDVWTFYLKIGASEVSGKLLLADIMRNDVTVHNDVKSGFENPLRLTWFKEAKKLSTGYFPGLQFDRRNRIVLNARPDKKKRVNRAVASTYSDKLRECIKVMKATVKLGVYDDVTLKYGWAHENAGKFEFTAEHRELTDDEYNILVERAVKQAVARVGVKNILEWRPNSHAAVMTPQHNWHNRIIMSAERYLREAFKNAYGAYEYLPID